METACTEHPAPLERGLEGTSAVSNDSWPEGGAGLEDSVHGEVPKKRMGRGVQQWGPHSIAGGRKDLQSVRLPPGPQATVSLSCLWK